MKKKLPEEKQTESPVITNDGKIMLGPSGSGKSFFTNHMLRQHSDQGTEVVLVEIGFAGMKEKKKSRYKNDSPSNQLGQ